MTAAAVPAPTDAEILAGLREAITAVLGDAELANVDFEMLGRDTALLSLPLDSLGLLQTMTGIEDRFRVFIPEKDAFAFTTVGQVLDYVRGKLAAKTARVGGHGHP